MLVTDVVEHLIGHGYCCHVQSQIKLGQAFQAQMEVNICDSVNPHQCMLEWTYFCNAHRVEYVT